MAVLTQIATLVIILCIAVIFAGTCKIRREDRAVRQASTVVFLDAFARNVQLFYTISNQLPSNITLITEGEPMLDNDGKPIHYKPIGTNTFILISIGSGKPEHRIERRYEVTLTNMTFR